MGTAQQAEEETHKAQSPAPSWAPTSHLQCQALGWMEGRAGQGDLHPQLLSTGTGCWCAQHCWHSSVQLSWAFSCSPLFLSHTQTKIIFETWEAKTEGAEGKGAQPHPCLAQSLPVQLLQTPWGTGQDPCPGA